MEIPAERIGIFDQLIILAEGMLNLTRIRLNAPWSTSVLQVGIEADEFTLLRANESCLLEYITWLKAESENIRIKRLLNEAETYPSV